MNINVMHHINKEQKSLDTGKTFDKIQPPLYDKT